MDIALHERPLASGDTRFGYDDLSGAASMARSSLRQAGVFHVKMRRIASAVSTKMRGPIATEGPPAIQETVSKREGWYQPAVTPLRSTYRAAHMKAALARVGAHARPPDPRLMARAQYALTHCPPLKAAQPAAAQHGQSDELRDGNDI